MADIADKLDCTLLPAARVQDATFASWLKKERVDMLINVHSLLIMRGDVVEAPSIGSFNLHPGPLPGHAGLNAPSWAIFNDESRHAMTLHWMTAGIGTGAIVSEAWFDLPRTSSG